MITFIIAGIITFVFTTVLTVAGVGAAFILIPIFIFLGIDLHVSMATALLLNAIAMTFASIRFIKARLIKFKIGLPILIIATIFSPLGAYTSKFLPVPLLKWLFVAFLVFAGSMMLLYKSKERDEEKEKISIKKDIIYGSAVGVFAGYLGGLLGVAPCAASQCFRSLPRFARPNQSVKFLKV
ncbi:MAG: sulfite exporter TauE/SafE family protein [Patescibacteria group bacterium]|nr:sulfite exporter TauE/SafE family protein [Patescibacteria group bacterium]